ncbi:MAG: hypothetical protein J0L66_18375 [Cytophagales bacterium]|nr:hypothetical protein [Cytophagales bacterium]
MKTIHKLSALALALMVSACDENDGIQDAVPVTTGTNYTANFLMINAVPGGSSLDFYVNGLKTGASVDPSKGQAGYASVQLTTPGLNSIANTSVRAKATSGTIGGVLGSRDAIYRAGNTNVNNMVAAPNARYTFIAIDSITRPAPVRTFSLNSLNVLAADATYFVRATGAQISRDQWLALPSDAERNKTVSIGTVPAGSTDVGGVRFLLLTDTYPTFPGGNTTQSAIRFVNAIPNSYSLPTNTRIYARLKPVVAGANIALASNAEYIASVAGGFNPSVGSRSTTTAFTLRTTTTGTLDSEQIEYNLELSTDNFTTISYTSPVVKFAVGKIYTIVATGFVGGTGNRAISAAIVQHN